MKVLVTGGAGFLGSHLVDALVARGDRVVSLDNLHRGSPGNLDGHVAGGAVRSLLADVREYGSLPRAMDGVEVVYHLAAQSNVMGATQDLDYSITTNVLGTFNVLKAAAEAGVRRVVFASSREVYGEPSSLPVPESAPLTAKNPYGASKVAGEAYCRAWGAVSPLECQVLRFVNLYGPRDEGRVIPLWLDLARRGEDLPLYGGDQVLDFLWVGHAVSALTAAAGCAEVGPVNVGSGTGTPLQGLARRILEAAGGRSKVRLLPRREAEVICFVADVTKMRTVLGVHPDRDPLARLGSL